MIIGGPHATPLAPEMLTHHPDIDLRYDAVTVRLSTHEVSGLSQRDVSLAQQISAAANDLGVTADRPDGNEVDIASWMGRE